MSQKSLTKNFHSGVKGSQDRCQNKYNQIWVKLPLSCFGYNNDRKREYVCAMSVLAGRVVNHPPWVPETFLAWFPVSASPLVASAYFLRSVFRPKLKISAAWKKKTSGTQDINHHDSEFVILFGLHLCYSRGST